MSPSTTLRLHDLDVSYCPGKLEAYLRAKSLSYELVAWAPAYELT